MTQEYFDWLLTLICREEYVSKKGEFYDILWYLFCSDFLPLHPRDINRIHDARYLKQVYCEIDPNMSDWLYESTSVLEIMILLAMRMEQEYMSDEECGDRTSVWFWEMMDNLGFATAHHNKTKMHSIVDKFLSRTYSPNGQGNLFYIPNADHDIREDELWVQMLAYLNNKFE